MDFQFCSSSAPFSFCLVQTLVWAFPIFCLVVLILYRMRAPRLHLHRNKNVNPAIIVQILLLMFLPFTEIAGLFARNEEPGGLGMADFLNNVGFALDAVLCAFLMRVEFPRIIRPGVYSRSIRLYLLLLLFLATAQLVLGILFSAGSLLTTLLVGCPRVSILFVGNAIGIVSIWKSRDLHLHPLLYEEEDSVPSGIRAPQEEKLILEKAKPDEEDEFRLTRSTSVMSVPPDLTSVKNEIMESRGFLLTKNQRGVSIDIPKVLISHDSSSEIIVLYEIRVYDGKGKSMRTIYRRFNEFETLHNELKEETKGTKIEGFPQKSLLFTISGRDNQDLIDYRKNALINYLQGLINNEILLGTKTVRDFLALTEI